MQQTPQITYCLGNNQRGKKIYTLNQNEVCVQTSLGQDKKLNVDPFISLDEGGLLTIKVNYSWNGMTMYPDSKETMFPSLVHDALYQLMRINFRKGSDGNGIRNRRKFRK